MRNMRDWYRACTQQMPHILGLCFKGEGVTSPWYLIPWRSPTTPCGVGDAAGAPDWPIRGRHPAFRSLAAWVTAAAVAKPSSSLF